MSARTTKYPTLSAVRLCFASLALIAVMATPHLEAVTQWCLRLEHEYVFGGSDATRNIGLYDFTLYDPAKGTSVDYGVTGYNVTGQNDAPVASPDGRYIARVLTVGAANTSQSHLIITSSGLDRNPLTDILLDSKFYIGLANYTWLPDNAHMLLTFREQNNVRVQLIDLSGNIVASRLNTFDRPDFPLFNYETSTQDHQQIIIFQPDNDYSSGHFEIWSARDLSLVKLLTFPDAVSNFYSKTPMLAWRPDKDEYAYIRHSGENLSAVVQSLQPNIPAVTIILPNKASDGYLNDGSGYSDYTKIEWSPNGHYLSITLYLPATTFSDLHVIDVGDLKSTIQEEKPVLQANVSRYVAAFLCSDYCPGPHARWTNDSTALHFLQSPSGQYSEQLNSNALIAYFPAEKRYVTLADHVYGVAIDPAQQWLYLSHDSYANSTFSFSSEYMRTDGSDRWTALYSTQVDSDLLLTSLSPDFRKAVRYFVQDMQSTLQWANRDTHQTFQADFPGKNAAFNEWSADSRLITFTVTDSTSATTEVGIADAVTGAYRIVAHNMPSNAGNIAAEITPTGTLLILQRSTSDKPYTARLFQADNTEITLNIPPGVTLDELTPWSPNGEQIALWETAPASQGRLLILDKNGNIIHDYTAENIDYSNNFVWTSCDQPLAGWTARNPQVVQSWP